MSQPTSSLRPLKAWLICVCIVAISIYLIIYLFLAYQVVTEFSKFGAIAGRDFIPFYSASELALQGRLSEAFNLASFIKVQSHFFPFIADKGWVWLYPSTFGFVILPLALLPPLVSYFIWDLTGVLIMGFACWRLWPSPWSLALGFANSAIFACAVNGQNTLIVAALCTLCAAAFLRGRQSEAGIWTGLLAIKPHLALVFPIAFAAGRTWRAFIVAGIVVMTFAAVTTLAFGMNYWEAFFSPAHPERGFLLQAPAMWIRTVTIYSTLRSVGLGAPMAFTLHFIAAFVIVMALTLLWVKKGATEESLAALLAATCLVPPYVMFYDLTILSPSIILLFISPLLRQKDEKLLSFVLILCYTVPFLIWSYSPFSSFIGFIAPLSVFMYAFTQGLKRTKLVNCNS